MMAENRNEIRKRMQMLLYAAIQTLRPLMLTLEHCPMMAFGGHSGGRGRLEPKPRPFQPSAMPLRRRSPAKTNVRVPFLYPTSPPLSEELVERGVCR